jgi:hypothetical protein
MAFAEPTALPDSRKKRDATETLAIMHADGPPTPSNDALVRNAITGIAVC